MEVGVEVQVTRKAGREIRNAQWPNLELDKAMKNKKQNKSQKLWIWKTKVNVNHCKRFSTPCWKFVIHASGLKADTFQKAKVFACFARLNVLSSIPEWEMINWSLKNTMTVAVAIQFILRVFLFLALKGNFFFTFLLLGLCVYITRRKKKFLEKWQKELFHASWSSKKLYILVSRETGNEFRCCDVKNRVALFSPSIESSPTKTTNLCPWMISHRPIAHQKAVNLENSKWWASFDRKRTNLWHTRAMRMKAMKTTKTDFLPLFYVVDSKTKFPSNDCLVIAICGTRYS